MSKVLGEIEFDSYGQPYPYQCSFLHFQGPADSFTLWSFLGEIVYTPIRCNRFLNQEETDVIKYLKKWGYTMTRLQ